MPRIGSVLDRVGGSGTRDYCTHLSDNLAVIRCSLHSLPVHESNKVLYYFVRFTVTFQNIALIINIVFLILNHW